MGCLATHVAWNHPRTAQLTVEAGINWLHHVAGLNPATSHLIREWDRRGSSDWEIRSDLAGGRIARVIFCIADDRMVLLHGFIKKTQKTPGGDLELALRRKKEIT